MAERRMFAKTIIDSDAFLDMPQSSQLLYFHLSMRADDEGFINNPKSIMRNVKCNEDDLKLLIAKKFIIPFESGILVIKHWKIHNYIRNDRYKETKYKDEKALLELDENNAYRLSDKETVGIPMVDEIDREAIGIPLVDKMDTQVRLGKVSIDNIYSPAEAVQNMSIVDKSVDNIVDKDLLEKIVNYLNQKCKASYKVTTRKTRELIKARCNEGFKLDDFRCVIDKKSSEWMGTDMAKYLRPETLFGPKFEGYLNEKVVRKVAENSKNKFHNFDQRTAGYSKEQLEAVGRKNFNKKLEELGISVIGDGNVKSV